MTATGLTRRLPLPYAVAGLAALLALIALLALAPLYAPAVLLAAVGVPFVLRRPTAALLLLVVVEVSNAGEVLPSPGGLSLYLVALVLALGAGALGLYRGTVQLVWSPVLLFAGVYFAARALSVLASPEAGLIAVTETAKDLVFLVVILTLLASRHGYGGATRAVVAITALLAGLALVQEFVLGNRTDFGGFSQVPLARDLGGTTARHSGPVADVNFWARNLVLFVPLALSLWAQPTAGPAADPRRWAWLGSAALLCGGLYLTQSRGGLLSLAVTLGCWAVLVSRNRRRLAWIAPVALVVLLAVPGVGSRLATLASSEDDDPSLIGRVEAMQVGAATFLDRPALGVGAGNFTQAWPQYARIALPEGTLAPHNLYLQMAAESGLVGLTGWLLFYGSALFVAARALALAHRPSGDPWPSPAVLHSAGIVAALVGWGFASVFLHLAHLRTFLFVVALGAALDLEARRTVAIPAPVAS